ncbi:MAG: hypothetical protein GF401_10175 [Chitinivibrionales bacterium]|nr:hypothetical protein [Chitinivibrionales bacterium]
MKAGYHGLFKCWTIMIMLLCTHCGYKYTEIISKSVHGPITASTFVVFPVTGLYYNAPSSCLFPSDISQAGRYEQEWNSTIRNKLAHTYPEQQWVFLEKGDNLLRSTGYSLDRIYSLAESKTLSHLVSRTQRGVIKRWDTPKSNGMGTILKHFQDSLGADYALMFMNPSLTGEKKTSYTPPMYGPNGMVSGGGFYTQTSYTSDIQFQVWDCRNGRLLYCSGAWDKSTSYCLFIQPQSLTIKSSARDVAERLSKVIAELLKNNRKLFAAESGRLDSK